MAGNLILIIDDDQAQHQTLGEYLKVSGYEVAHAYEGSQGLVVMEAQKPDMILLDIQMPIMDGFKTLEVIRKKPDFKDIPVMLLTSLDRDYLKIKGLDLGADDYIIKPLNSEELLARVNAAIRRSGRNKPGERGMEGSLSDIGLTDIMQSLQLGSKTASIFLKDMDGEIYIQNGALLGARQGAFTGDQALTRIFLLEKGGFIVRFNELPTHISGKTKSLMSALMNVTADVDEIKDVVSRIRANDHLIKLKNEVSDFPALERFNNFPPVSFIDMIVSMEGDPKDNLKTLITAWKEGKLTIAK